MERFYIGHWSVGLIFCEILNFLNIILQIYVTNKFLNGRFLDLGISIWKYGYEASVDVLEIVFPKVSKVFVNKRVAVFISNVVII